MERTHRHLFQSLPPYLGGKRSLARAIFEDCASLIAPGEWADSTFLDVFSGGGAVSLTAKALGFTVHCNDLADRATIVGRALIANSEVVLSKADLILLFHGSPDLTIEQAALRFLPAAHARFLAGAIPAARACPGPKQWLLLLVLLKWVLRLLPMSSPAASDAQRAAQLELDHISPKRVRQYLRARHLLLPSVLWQISEEVNAGVIPGHGTASQLDAVEFLQSHDGDIAYLDPPYPGTTSYEVEYRPLDVLFGGAPIPRSRYSSAAPPLDALLAAAGHVPRWVISFGAVTQRRWSTSSASAARTRQSAVCHIAIWRRFRKGAPMSTSSSPGAELLELPLSALQPHPANPNVMGRDALAKLRRHIERSGNYPPLVIRPFGDGFQIIDGHQRAAVLRELGRLTASCVVWACDDETALLLLATLNRLHGEDVPGRRAALLDELVESMGRDNLLALIPEDAAALDDLLALLPGGDDPFAALEAEATKALAQMPVTLTVVVEAEDEREILRVLDQLITGRPGARSRGAALARMTRHFAECERRDA